MFSRRLLSVLSLSFGALSLSPSDAHAQLCQANAANVVTNCGFELNPQAPGAYYPNASLTGWISSDGTYERWVGGYDNFAAREGISHAELNVNAPTGLWQYVSTVTGGRYDLSFSAAHRLTPGVANSYSEIEVWIDNAFVFTTGMITTGYTWRDFSTSFFAAGPSTKLEFRGVGNGGSYGNHLDNIVATSQSSSTVPEPSTYVLMGSGLAALFVMARRRRSK